MSDIKGNSLISRRICPVCHKEFYITSWQQDWVYRISNSGKPVCSYHCLQEYRRNIEEKRKRRKKQ